MDWTGELCFFIRSSTSHLFNLYKNWITVTLHVSQYVQICCSEMQNGNCVTQSCVVSVCTRSWHVTVCCVHLVQRRPLHQLKRGGVYTYLLHIDGFIELFLFPGFDLHQPITRERGYSEYIEFLMISFGWFDCLVVGCVNAKSMRYSTSSGDMVSVNGGAAVSWGKETGTVTNRDRLMGCQCVWKS